MKNLLFILMCLPMTLLSSEHQLINIETACPSIKLDIRYATENNFLGFPVYPKAACYLHREVAEALFEVQQELLEQDLGLIVFDGYRPLSVQQIMWDLIQDDRYVANPAIYKGRHTRGTAVDLSIIDAEGNLLEMPSEFDEFTENAHADYQEATQEALQNREKLRDVMERHHFTQLPTEWWHFDFKGWKDDEKFPPLDLSFDELSS
jgi:D-alanyl-D-alanine dipeptidase